MRIIVLALASLLVSVLCSHAQTTETRKWSEIPDSEKVAWGRSIFMKDCLACHSVEGENKYGPPVNDILNRKIGAAEGFGYSDAFKEMNSDGKHWSDENLRKFLASPQEFAPGSIMWVRIPDEEVVDTVALFLKSISTK